MFDYNSISREFDVDIAMNSEMSKKIELWKSMYSNKPPWEDDNISSMGLPGAIANELARLVTIEFKSEIKNNDFLNKEYQSLLNELRINCELACAKGGIVFKPYISDDHIEIDVIQQDKFFPVSYNSKEITAAIFIEVKIAGDKRYTRLEYHSLDNNIYTIKNKAFVRSNIGNDKTLGKNILLSEVPGWETLEEEVNIKNVDHTFFSYFKIPQANTIDENSPLGVSVYNKADRLIEEADKQYSRILWEFEATEVAINASESIFNRDKNGNYTIPQGNKRLFRLFNWENKEGDKMIETYSPEIRDMSLFNGLNNILRKIEFNCGLAYGTLSDINDTDKTATEIKASKQRSYSTVKDIQKSLEKALKDLILAMHTLAVLYKVENVKDVDIDKDITFEWDDSLILDKDSELESMRNDVVANILRPEIYLAKKYGVSEQEALKLMPSLETTVSKSKYDELEE